MTPQEAFAHAKALWPEVTCIRQVKTSDYENTTAIGSRAFHVDWPDGMRQYPPEIRWRRARWPDDARNEGVPCRCWESTANAIPEYHMGVLIGRYPSLRWALSDGTDWERCEVEDR